MRQQEAPLALCQPCCPHGLALPLCDSSILRSGRQRASERKRKRTESSTGELCFEPCVCVCVCVHMFCAALTWSPQTCALFFALQDNQLEPHTAGCEVKHQQCHHHISDTFHCFWSIQFMFSRVCTWNPQTSFMIYCILIFNGLSFLLPNLSVHR